MKIVNSPDPSIPEIPKCLRGPGIRWHLRRWFSYLFSGAVAVPRPVPRMLRPTLHWAAAVLGLWPLPSLTGGLVLCQHCGGCRASDFQCPPRSLVLSVCHGHSCLHQVRHPLCTGAFGSHCLPPCMLRLHVPSCPSQGQVLPGVSYRPGHQTVLPESSFCICCRIGVRR